MRKTSLIIIVLLYFTFAAFAQSKNDNILQNADTANLYGNYYYAQGDYEEAFTYYKKAAELSLKVDGGYNLQYAMAANGIACVLYVANNYEKSVEYNNYALTVRKELLGEDHPDYAASLKNIGVVYYDMGKYKEALENSLQALEIQKKTMKKDNPEYINTMGYVAASYYGMNDYQNAIKYYLQLLEIQKKAIGENHPNYARYLTNVGVTYAEMGDYQNALKYYLPALDLQQKTLGEDNPNYLSTLEYVADTYYKMEDYRNAFKYYAQAVDIELRTEGESHPDYLSSTKYAGLASYKFGDYKNSLKYSIMQMELRKKTQGEKSSDYLISLSNVGIIYYGMKDYQNALKCLLLEKQSAKEVYGEDDVNYINMISSLGVVYFSLGDYQNAMKYTTMAMEMRKKKYGENHQHYANSLSNMASLYLDMGDKDNAFKYIKQATEIRMATLKENDPEYEISLNNLGEICHDLGYFNYAMKYLQRALEIRKKYYGEESEDYASTLHNIASLYSDMNENEKALKCYKESLEITRKTIGSENPSYANTLMNIGVEKAQMGDMQNALTDFNTAAKILKKTIGEKHPSYANCINNKSYTYSMMGDYSNAIKTKKQVTEILKDNLIKNFSFMTSHERETYWNDNKKIYSQCIFNSFHATSDTLGTKISYDVELTTKGLLLASEISMTNIIMESGDKNLIADYENLKNMHLLLNKEQEKPMNERVYNCDSLSDEIKKAERQVMERSKDFGDVTLFIKIDWKEVQKSMKANDVAIEFSNVADSGIIRYAAIVLTKNMNAPVFVPLFNKEEMQKILRGVTPSKTQVQTDDSDRGAKSVSAKKLGVYESTELYKTVWMPLEKYFPANPRIYFAPSGMLHQIAIEYAPISHEQTISDKYEIYRVSSTRFLAMDYMPGPMKNSVFYGGIYYDSDTTTMKQESSRFATRSVSYNSFAELNKDEVHDGLNYLPGTKTEVENIVGTLKNNKKVKTTLYEGSQANEESFKALSGNNISVLHIATHGFFLPTEKKLSGDMSLIQSGLLLSGANYAWQNLPLPEGIEDGILTAKEISFMDLRKTDLVVLSACQTALGEITDEGVFGLQRGFKKAGVRTIIMSLWPVDDNATLLMMTEFYSNLTKGMSKREAFLAAQNKVKTTAGFENPRYWAAFIMLDGNEN
ncbi:MAG: tetratricopeptide repeat protein [Bacteroidales bacterium]|nr:tetratricopeptide repeat protein [Bacteroidales bacterium]